MARNGQPQEDPDVVFVKVNNLALEPRTPTRLIPTRYDDISILELVKTPPCPETYRRPLFAHRVQCPFPVRPACNFTTVGDVFVGPPSAPDPADRTASHGEQDKWNLYNLPDILYVLSPGREHLRSQARIRMTRYLIFGKPVRDFAILPHQISSCVEGWRLEAWMRLDQRITEQDIIDRVNPEFRAKLSPDYPEYRRQFFRANFHLACWGSPQSMSEICNLMVKNGLDPARNSTRGLTPGLKDPAKGEAGGRVPFPSPQVCTVAADGGKQPFPTSVVVPNQQIPQNQYPGRVPAVNTPQIPSDAPPVPQPVFVQPSTIHGPPRVQQAQYMAPYSAPPCYGKRKWVEPTRQENPPPFYKKERISGHGHVDGQNGYPYIPNELAPCRAPLPRPFPREGNMGGRTMPLEEYLQTNSLTYDEFLRARYANEIPGISGGPHYHSRRA